MSDAIFCPACHHKNAADAEVCSFCGASMVPPKMAKPTTGKLAPAPIVTGRLDAPGRRYLPKLPENSFALFVMDNPDPLFIENSEAVYLGRFAQVPTASSVDLTQYNAAEMGVSRSHARITWSEGIYELEDLASSNGTWLNYLRLAYGKSYELHNGDIILLGQLQLTICLPESTRKWEVSFDAKRSRTRDTVYLQIFTPCFMQTVLSTFLQAIVDLQQVCLLCRGQKTEDVHILSIKAAHQSPLLHISLDNANEAVHYIRKWVNPLRQVYAGLSSPETEVEGPVFQKGLFQTMDSLLRDINPGLDEDALKGFAKQLQPIIKTLVSSELEIINQ